MTEILNKEFSRTSFLKGGGAMIVGFSMAGAAVGARTASTAGIVKLKFFPPISAP
jgi:hypothetical protein